MRRLAVGIGVLVGGCGATVDAGTHQSALAKQLTDYEDRLYKADQECRRARNKADRDRVTAEARVDQLDRRILRLERAEVEVCPPPDPGPTSGLVRALRSALPPPVDVVAGGNRAAEWRIPASQWFDTGSSQLREPALAALDSLAEFLSARPALAVRVTVVPAAPASATVIKPGWQEASLRGVALLAALHGRGVAPARLTLVMTGDGPEARIVFAIGSRRRAR